MSKHRSNTRDFRQRGQAMVEMIVISFVALLLLLGIIQFALLYNAKTVLNYAAFEA
ncbi:MAG: TadE/TadG family type IV pilus assembly protein, partial [Pseudomonadales bacterium]